MIINAEVQYRAYGVGKNKSKHVFLNIKGQHTLELPKSCLKNFFPNLRYGSDYATQKVRVEIL